MKREPVVAGSFYPQSARELEAFIKQHTPLDREVKEAKAAMLPHAGYIYSGPVAVATVASLKPKEFIVILGPNHTGRGSDFSVYQQGSWRTALGEIEIDAEFAEKLTAGEGILEADTRAHAEEHSIEVELPILKYFFKEFKFVPIVCMTAEAHIYKEIAGIIYRALNLSQRIDKSMIIASSDMTHYEEQAQAVKKDRYVLDAIRSLDSESFLSRISEKNVSMCGVAPVAVMLETIKLMGARTGRLIKYATSADVTGDYGSVVGYAGLIFN